MIETIQILDGATGTMIQKAGIDVPKIPELLNVLAPETLIAIHEAYARAGSQIVYANTFGASPMKLEGTGYTVEDIVKAGVANARQGAPACLVALDIGPLGQLMEPMGSFSFEDAYAQFAAMVKAGNDADLIVIETMSDLLETKAAVLAAKENSELPVYVTMSFEENGRTFTGCTLESMAMTLEGLGVDALGFNCSIGPDGMVGLVKRLARLTSLPIIAKPNAGLPDPATGAYTMDADSFAASMEQLVEAGASRIGGCCGTDPSFIERIARWKGEPLERADVPSQSKVCTPLMALELNTIHPVGERINPTGKKRFQQALLEPGLYRFDRSRAKGGGCPDFGCQCRIPGRGRGGYDAKSRQKAAKRRRCAAAAGLLQSRRAGRGRKGVQRQAGAQLGQRRAGKAGRRAAHREKVRGVDGRAHA